MDIDKTYYEDDRRKCVQLLIKSEQVEVIVTSQDVANKVFEELKEEQ